MCARRRTYFLFARKESRQRKSAPQSASLRFAAGNLRCSVLGWCRRTHCVWPVAKLRSNSCGKPDHEVRVSFGTRTHPRPCASRRSQKGWERGHGQLLLRSCALGWFALRAADMQGYRPGESSAAKDHEAEQSNGPYGARSHPLLTVPRSTGPGVSACRRTRASLSGLPQLFDRSCETSRLNGGVLRQIGRVETVRNFVFRA